MDQVKIVVDGCLGWGGKSMGVRFEMGGTRFPVINWNMVPDLIRSIPSTTHPSLEIPIAVSACLKPYTRRYRGRATDHDVQNLLVFLISNLLAVQGAVRVQTNQTKTK